MISMKETGQGMYVFVYLLWLIGEILHYLSFLNEARIVAALTDKQIGSSHLPIVSRVPVVTVGELQKKRHL